MRNDLFYINKINKKIKKYKKKERRERGSYLSLSLALEKKFNVRRGHEEMRTSAPSPSSSPYSSPPPLPFFSLFAHASMSK